MEWLLNSIPYVLQLVVGVVGLVITLSTRDRGRGTGLLVTAFALMMASYVGWLGMGWVDYHAPSITANNHLSVSTWEELVTAGAIVLGMIEVAAWLLVALGVLRIRARQPQRPQPFGAPAWPAPGAPTGQPAPFGQPGPSGQPAPFGEPGPFSPPPPGTAGPA